jgi:hypothetical protein
MMNPDTRLAQSASAKIVDPCEINTTPLVDVGSSVGTAFVREGILSGNLLSIKQPEAAAATANRN